jgi:hypothetical protein
VTQPQWEDIEVPRGAFIGWGTKIGQHVTGKVLEYSIEGGNDFYNKPCPQASIELTEDASSFTKDGDRSVHSAGELVVLNAGQVSLKRALRSADPKPGDLVKITLSAIVPLDGGKSVKEFNIKIARGAGGAVAARSTPASFGGGDDEPPF